ncbi:MAG: RNA methyltransferase [Clostridiales bacterium]|nr:RNA methyltransferase [Clostridiales bacterium]
MNYKITSTSNERIKFLKTLKTKKGRNDSKTYLIEGKRAVLDALSHNVKFNCLILEEGLNFDINASCDILTVPRHIIATLSETSSPEGIIAQAFIPDLTFDINKISGLTVFLDRLQDAGNIGTIIRTCDALGASAVVLSPGCCELFNPKTVRATMGSIFNINVMIADNSIETLNQIKNIGYTVYSAALQGEDFNKLNDINSNKSCVIIGNEGNGICDEILSVSDKIITLKMCGGAESLNASIAAGILIYNFMNC